MVDPDSLNSVSAAGAGRAAMAVIDAIQDQDHAEAITGLTVVFVNLCKLLGVSPARAAEVAKNVIEGSDGIRPEYRAVTEYLKQEIING